MRDFGSCLGDYAVQISDASCSSHSSSSCVSPAPELPPSVQNSVACLYRTVLPGSQRRIFVTLTWCRSSSSSSQFQGLSIALNDDAAAAVKLTTGSRFFRKAKGAKTVDFHGVSVELVWDLTTARYGSCPEPIDGFFILMTVDSAPILLLGDKKTKPSSAAGKFSLISRQEHFSGHALYSTRARFSDAGSPHNILIRCGVDGDTAKSPVLSVSIDKKTVIRVKRLQWNFRGNQTIFLDGLLVDLLWDVHDWFHISGPGCGRFLFRTRTGLDSRLWLEDKLHEDEDKLEFSLMIYAHACNNL